MDWVGIIYGSSLIAVRIGLLLFLSILVAVGFGRFDNSLSVYTGTLCALFCLFVVERERVSVYAPVWLFTFNE